MKKRIAVIIGLTTLVLGIAAGPALAQGDEDGRPRLRDSDRRISLTGGVIVAEGDFVDGQVVSFNGPVVISGDVNDDVLVVDGNVTIDGSVNGDVLVIEGDLRISGEVDNNVAVINGRATVSDGAVVRGDVRSSDQPRVAPGARVTGEVKKIDVAGIGNAIGWTLLAYLWIAITVSTFLLGLVVTLLFPRAMETVARTGRERVGPVIGWGLLVGIGLPVVAGFATVSVVALPLGLGTLSALGVVYALGYVAAATWLGRLMVKAPGAGRLFLAFLAGFGILRAAALIPGLGVLVWWVASLFGLGMLVVAGWRAARPKAAEGGDDGGERPPTPAEPTAPPPSTDEPSAPTEPSESKESEAPKESKEPATTGSDT